MSHYDSIIDVDSPVSHWKLGTSTATDRKGIRNLSAVNGPIASGSGLVANNSEDLASTFAYVGAEQASQHFSLPSTAGVGTPYNTATWSIEAWFSHTGNTRTEATSSDVFKHANNRLRLDMYEEDQLWYIDYYGGGDDTVWYELPASPGQLFHVVGVYNGTDLILYLDGQEVVRGTRTVQAPKPDASPIIGAFWDGSIDEVAFYGTALSAARVLAHYQAGTIAVSAPRPPHTEIHYPVGQNRSRSRSRGRGRGRR